MSFEEVFAVEDLVTAWDRAVQVGRLVAQLVPPTHLVSAFELMVPEVRQHQPQMFSPSEVLHSC